MLTCDPRMHVEHHRMHQLTIEVLRLKQLTDVGRHFSERWGNFNAYVSGYTCCMLRSERPPTSSRERQPSRYQRSAVASPVPHTSTNCTFFPRGLSESLLGEGSEPFNTGCQADQNQHPCFAFFVSCQGIHRKYLLAEQLIVQICP